MPGKTGLTKEEERILIILLKKVKKDGMSDELFNAYAASGFPPYVAIEVIVYRKTERGYEILLTQRPEDDPFWPNLWHSAGTVLRDGEEQEDAFARIFKEELKFGYYYNERVIFRGWHNTFTKRGHGVSLAYSYHFNHSFGLPIGKFFPIDQLPKDIVQSQIPVIELVTKKLKKESQSL